MPQHAQHTADRLDLLELVAAYAITVDARDIDAIVDCFAPDARLEFVSDSLVLHGHDEIRRFYVEAFRRPGLSSGVSTHVMTNTMIRFDEPLGGTSEVAGTARLITQAIAHLPDGAGQIAVRGLVYTDRCVRTAAGWRFADRQHRLLWAGTMPGNPA